MDVAIYDTIELAAGPDFGGFGGETYVGTLENNGVGVAGGLPKVQFLTM